MKVIKWFKKAFQDFNTARWNAGMCKKYFPDHKYVIEFAFEVAGVEYFRYNDVFNSPYERGIMSWTIYEEVKMGVSREYLEKHIEVNREITHDKNNIDIFKINMLNEQLAERLEMKLDADLLYKLASVVYFDKSEIPVLYDATYCKSKIEFWKKHKGVADFFLQKPIQELMPFLLQYGDTLEAYLIYSMELNKIHLERLDLLSSKSSSTASKFGKKQ